MRSKGKGVKIDGRQDGMASAMSGVSGGSKPLDTRPLAETDSS